MNLDTLTNRSPHSDSIDAGNRGNVNVTRVEAGPKLNMMLLALSIMVNGACFWEIFVAERESRLASYETQNVRAEVLGPLKAQSDALEKRVDTLQMQLAIRQETHR